MTLTEKHWGFLHKAFRYIGFAGCAIVSIWLTILIHYYSVNRPHVPQPGHEWTVRLEWSISPPSYGTADENARLISLFYWALGSFILIAIGEAIRIYKLKGYKDDIYKKGRWYGRS